MRILALSLVLLSTPAQAHCFSRWHYPYPQKCWTGRAAAPKIYRVSQAAPAPAVAPKKSTELNWGPPADIPDIPIDPFAHPSQPPEEDGRATALTQLRTELNGH